MFLSSEKLIRVVCVPNSTEVIQNEDFKSLVEIERGGLEQFQFAPFKSSNTQCPVIGYEFKQDSVGILLSTEGCDTEPCNKVMVHTNMIKGDSVSTRLVVKTLGNGTFDSSIFKISLVSKTEPHFQESLPPIKLTVGSTEKLVYVSP